MARSNAPNLLGSYQATFFKHLKMLHDRRQRHVERLRQLADGRGCSAQLPHDAPAAGIRKGVKHAVHGFRLVKHKPKYHAAPRTVKLS
jgi:hypothetical protein